MISPFFIGERMSNYKIHGHTKNSVLYGHCVMCLEKSKFRHCLVDGINSIVCVICLSAKPIIPKKEMSYMILDSIDLSHIIHRFFIRLNHPARTDKILKHRSFIYKFLRRGYEYSKRYFKNFQQ